MLKVRIVLILIANMVMLSLADLFALLKMRKPVMIILKQANINMKYIESEIGGNNNE